MEIDLRKEEIKTKYKRQLKYKLEDLMDKCDINAPFTEEEMAWLNLSSVGMELK